MQKKKNEARRKFDLLVEFQRRNKTYEERCRKEREAKHKVKQYQIKGRDPFVMTNDELWEMDHAFDFAGIGKYSPLTIDFQKIYLVWLLKREPTTDELLNHLKNILEEGCYIHVSDPSLPITTLTREFKEIIEKEKSKSANPEKNKNPFAGYRIQELERYLAVYDARENLVNGRKPKWISVWQQLNPKKDLGEFDEEARQCLLRDHRKARELIEKSPYVTTP